MWVSVSHPLSLDNSSAVNVWYCRNLRDFVSNTTLSYATLYLSVGIVCIVASDPVFRFPLIQDWLPSGYVRIFLSGDVTVVSPSILSIANHAAVIDILPTKSDPWYLLLLYYDRCCIDQLVQCTSSSPFEFFFPSLLFDSPDYLPFFTKQGSVIFVRHPNRPQYETSGPHRCTRNISTHFFPSRL